MKRFSQKKKKTLFFPSLLLGFSSLCNPIRCDIKNDIISEQSCNPNSRKDPSTIELISPNAVKWVSKKMWLKERKKKKRKKWNSLCLIGTNWTRRLSSIFHQRFSLSLLKLKKGNRKWDQCKVDVYTCDVSSSPSPSLSPRCLTQWQRGEGKELITFILDIQLTVTHSIPLQTRIIKLHWRCEIVYFRGL